MADFHITPGSYPSTPSETSADTTRSSTETLGGSEPSIATRPSPTSFSFSPSTLRQRVGAQYLRESFPISAVRTSFGGMAGAGRSQGRAESARAANVDEGVEDKTGGGTESGDDKGKENEDGKVADFECNICFESATDPVVTLCGHLYCWPCLAEWLDRSTLCPVCKAGATKDNVIPVYARGASRGSSKPIDPRTKPRPAAQRPEPPVQQQRHPGGSQWAFHTPFGSFGSAGAHPGLGPFFPFGMGFSYGNDPSYPGNAHYNQHLLPQGHAGPARGTAASTPDRVARERRLREEEQARAHQAAFQQAVFMFVVMLIFLWISSVGNTTVFVL